MKTVRITKRVTFDLQPGEEISLPDSAADGLIAAGRAEEAGRKPAAESAAPAPAEGGAKK